MEQEHQMVMSTGLSQKRLQQAEIAKDYQAKCLRNTLKHPIFNTVSSSDDKNYNPEEEGVTWERQHSDRTRQKKGMLINATYHPNEEEMVIVTRCMESAQDMFECGMKMAEKNATVSETLMMITRDLYENIGRLIKDENAKMYEIKQTVARLQSMVDQNIKISIQNSKMIENAVHQAMIAVALLISGRYRVDPRDLANARVTPLMTTKMVLKLAECLGNNLQEVHPASTKLIEGQLAYLMDEDLEAQKQTAEQIHHQLQ